MKKNILIKKANTKDYKKINQFHNDYYKSNRTMKQFLWLFKKEKRSKNIDDYYYALKQNKIIGILGFIKFNFIFKKKKFTVIKPEDLLMSIEAVKANIFEKIIKKYEKKISNSYDLSILFNIIGWAFKRVKYIPNFGDREIIIKYYNPKSIASSIIKKKFPNFFSLLISFFFIFLIRILSSAKKILNKNQLNFKNYNKPPIWSDNINKNFSNYWKFLTIDRNKDFLKWRVFNNPFIRSKFTAFYHKKKPIGYIVYNKNMNSLLIADLIVVPTRDFNNINEILNEVLIYLDDCCLKNKLNYCKFELYFNNKLNNFLKKSLLNNGYLSKQINTNFSFKTYNKQINKKVLSQSYLTNINKSGKWH